jgi:hypothetical protein
MLLIFWPGRADQRSAIRHRNVVAALSTPFAPIARFAAAVTPIRRIPPARDRAMARSTPVRPPRDVATAEGAAQVIGSVPARSQQNRQWM